VSATLRFPGERLATFMTSFGATATSEYFLVGTQGSLRLSPAYDYQQPVSYELTIGEEPMKRKRFPVRDQFGPELTYFSDCILKGREPEPSGVEGLADIRIVRAIMESARTQKPVALDPFEKRHRPTKQQEISQPPVERPDLVNASSPSGN